MRFPLALTTEERSDEFGLMRRLSREMDRLFEDFGFKPLQGDQPIAVRTWMPDLEILERDGKFIVRADLPGLTKDDVKVNVAENVLTIEGERKQETETKREGFYRSERRYGAFYRTLPLPEGVKIDQLQATFKNGVLEVMVPITPIEKKAKSIEVKAA
jgi:HSP20 family protein